jgi:hypothetical protein
VTCLIRFFLLVYLFNFRACELNKYHIISTDEDPGLRIESFAVINLLGVSTNKTIIKLPLFHISMVFPTVYQSILFLFLEGKIA